MSSLEILAAWPGVHALLAHRVAHALYGARVPLAPRLIAGESLWGTYHFTGTGATTWHGFASHIVTTQASLTGRRPTVTAITTADYPTRAARPRYSVLDTSKLRAAFGVDLPSWQRALDPVIAELVS